MRINENFNSLNEQKIQNNQVNKNQIDQKDQIEIAQDETKTTSLEQDQLSLNQNLKLEKEDLSKPNMEKKVQEIKEKILSGNYKVETKYIVEGILKNLI